TVEIRHIAELPHPLVDTEEVVRRRGYEVDRPGVAPEITVDIGKAAQDSLVTHRAGTVSPSEAAGDVRQPSGDQNSVRFDWKRRRSESGRNESHPCPPPP